MCVCVCVCVCVYREGEENFQPIHKRMLEGLWQKKEKYFNFYLTSTKMDQKCIRTIKESLLLLLYTEFYPFAKKLPRARFRVPGFFFKSILIVESV